MDNMDKISMEAIMRAAKDFENFKIDIHCIFSLSPIYTELRLISALKKMT